jgi:hypothetical protein
MLGDQVFSPPAQKADGRTDAVQQAGIEAGRQADGLGKDGRRHGADGAMQRLRPPVVEAQVQPLDLGRDVDELADLLVQRHAGDLGGGLLLDDVAGERGIGRRRRGAGGEKEQADQGGGGVLERGHGKVLLGKLESKEAGRPRRCGRPAWGSARHFTKRASSLR